MRALRIAAATLALAAVSVFGTASAQAAPQAGTSIASLDGWQY